jgi:NAD(P)-dependent dehydrogenase (short-subunit alcohol dehydrogenase family)
MITRVSRVPRAVPLPRCLTDQQWRTSWAVHSNGSGFDAVQPSTCDPVLLVARRPIAPSLPECESFHTSTLAWLLTGVMVADESPFPAATYSHDPGWVLVRAALPVFRQQGFGHFVHMASTAAFLTLPNQAVYSGTKAAVRGSPKDCARRPAKLSGSR